MTRLLVAVVGTVCALVLVLSYRTPRVRHDQRVGHVAVAPATAWTALGAGPPPPLSSVPAAGTAPAPPVEATTGSMEGWSYGHLQVRVSVAGQRIVDVRVVQLATTNPMSRRRSTAAVKRLRSEVLSRQRADVDVVSGATYTSTAYMSSLQAALDTAGWHH